MTLPRLLLVALVLAALSAVGGAAAQQLVGGGTPRPVGERIARVAAPVRPRRGGSPPTRRPGSARLRAVGRATGGGVVAGADPAALRALYVPGSVAGRRDVAMLQAWTARGLRVRGLRMQVLALDVVLRTRSPAGAGRHRPGGAGGCRGPGVRRELPRDAPSAHTVELVRVAGEWRVAAVRRSRSRSPQPAPQPAR